MSQKIPLYYSLPAIILSALVATTIVLAWTEPSQAPTGGNAPAPLNVSSASQYKSGALGIGGLLRGYSNAIFDGNVGIGTASPSQKLHVAGNARITGLANCNTIDTDASGNLACGTDETGGTGGVTGSGIANYVSKWTAGTTLGNSIIYDNGNVGIGTTGPGYKLDVQGGGIRASGWTRIGNAAAEAIQFETQGTFHRVAFSNLRFWDWDTGGDMVTFENGNVGIGITNPSQKLDVAGRGYFSDKIGTAGKSPDCPNGWGCGVHTWDVYADASIRTDTLCLGGGVGTANTGDCRTSWPSGGVVGNPCYDIYVDQEPVDRDTAKWFVCNAGYTVTGVYYVTAAAPEYSRLISIRCCK